MSHPDNCLFCKIAAGTIPSRKVYEDDELFAFHDIHPWAPVHFLMIPKVHITSMAQVGDEHAALLGRMLVLAPKLALEQGDANGGGGGSAGSILAMAAKKIRSFGMRQNSR